MVRHVVISKDESERIVSAVKWRSRYSSSTFSPIEILWTRKGFKCQHIKKQISHLVFSIYSDLPSSTSWYLAECIIFNTLSV